MTLARGAGHGLSSRAVGGHNHRAGTFGESLATTRPHLTSDSTGRALSSFFVLGGPCAPVNRSVRPTLTDNDD